MLPLEMSRSALARSSRKAFSVSTSPNIAASATRFPLIFAPDDDRRARRQKREETLHAPAKIALALRQPTDPSPRRPKALCDILVLSNGEYRRPGRGARSSECRMG